MTIRTAIFGAGFAKAAYLPALATVPDVEVVALASGRLENAQVVAKQFNIPAAYDDWRTLVDKHPVDLVCVWLGDMSAISGQVATLVPDRVDKATGLHWTATADDQFSFMAEMQSGTLASVFVSSAARHGPGNSVQIYGSEGTIKLSDS